MNAERALLVAGVLLLSWSALLGFVQQRHRNDPALFAHWRVVHNGGTAGAVQLLALAAVWHHLPPGPLRGPLAVGIIASTHAFFWGPLAGVIGWRRLSRVLLLLGAGLALPAYLGLPLLLL